VPDPRDVRAATLKALSAGDAIPELEIVRADSGSMIKANELSK